MQTIECILKIKFFDESVFYKYEYIEILLRLTYVLKNLVSKVYFSIILKSKEPIFLILLSVLFSCKYLFLYKKLY